MASTVGRCINLLECSIAAIEKWHQQLECASIVGMETENGINNWNMTSIVGMMI
jgi:hypothetical protein